MLNLIPVKGTPRRTSAFVERGNSKSGLENFEVIEYPQSKEGLILRGIRMGLDIDIREAAKRLKLSTAQYCGLEMGKYTLSELDWTAASSKLTETKSC